MNTSLRYWSSLLPAVREPQVPAILRRQSGGITLDGARIAVSSVDVFLMTIADRAIKFGEPLVLGHPDPLNSLVVLVPAAAHIARMAETRKSSDRRIVVVTRNPRLRYLYRRLGVGSALLRDVVPAISLNALGYLERLGSKDSTGFTAFVGSVSDVSRVPSPDLIIVDSPESLSGSYPPRLPTIFLIRNPGDIRARSLAKTFPTFYVNGRDLKTAEPVRVVDGPQLANALERLEVLKSGSTVELRPVEAPIVAANFSLLWDDLGPLLRAAGRSVVAAELAKAAFQAMYDLLHLSVPLSRYENACGSVRSLVRHMQALGRRAQGELGDVYLPMVAAELEGMAEGLGEIPIKATILRNMVSAWTKDTGKTIVVARNVESAALLRQWLESELGREVGVFPYSQLSTIKPVQTAIFTGLAPRWARDLYFSGIAQRVTLLGYSGASAVDEATLIKESVSAHATFGQWLSRDALKAQCVSYLYDLPLKFEDDQPQEPVIDALPGNAKAEEPDDSFGSSFDDLWTNLTGRLVGEESHPPGSRQDSEGLGPGSRDIVRIQFVDGRWAYLDGEAPATVLVGVETQTTLAGDLTPGDNLFVIDGMANKTVLSKVLEVAQEIPELAVAAAWMEPWRQTVASARERFGSYTQFAEALRERGCELSTVAIRLWAVGVTIGPRSSLDVQRVGEVMGVKVLQERSHEVWRAMTTLRGAHVRLGQKLASLARKVGPAAYLGQLAEDEVLDERSGLTVSDFKGSVELIEVVQTSKADEDVPAFLLGRVYTEGELN